MKIIIQLASILFVLLFFTTCKKDIRHTFVEGIAQDYYTKEPIAETMVQLKGPGGDEYNTITTVYTDANGHFEFEKFRAEKSGDYYVNISGKNYDSYNKDGSANVVTGKKNKLIPTMARSCLIDFKLNRISNQTDSAKICLSLDDSEDKVITPELRGYRGPACFQQTIQLGASTISANINLKYYYTINSNGNVLNYSSVLFTKHDTLITINF